MADSRGKENGGENGRENGHGGSKKRARDERRFAFQVDDETPADLTERLRAVGPSRKRRSFSENGLPRNFNEMFNVMIWTMLPMSNSAMGQYHTNQSDNTAHKDGAQAAADQAAIIWPDCNYDWAKVIQQRLKRMDTNFTQTGKVNHQAILAVAQYEAHLGQQALQTPRGASILSERRTNQITAARPAAVLARRPNVVRPKSPEAPFNAYEDHNRVMREERARESRERMLPYVNALDGITPTAQEGVELTISLLTDAQIKVATEAVLDNLMLRKVTKWPTNMGPRNTIWAASVGWSQWYPELPEVYRGMVDRSVTQLLNTPLHIAHKSSLTLPVAPLPRTTPRGNASSAASTVAVKETSAEKIVKEFRAKAIVARKLTGDARKLAERFSTSVTMLVGDSEHNIWGVPVPFEMNIGGQAWSVDHLGCGSVISHLMEVDGQEPSRYRGVIVAMLIEGNELHFVVDYVLFERNDFECVTLKVEDFVGLMWLKDYWVNEKFDLMDVNHPRRPVSATGMTDLRRGGECDEWKVAVGAAGNEKESSHAESDDGRDDFMNSD
jgi:hypothetical protein